MHNQIHRRTWLKQTLAGAALAGASPWMQLAAQAAAAKNRKRSCIVLWMAGGPSQLDTFDVKPGTENGGPFQAIATSANGVRICEHLPRVARQMHHYAVVRSMQTKEGDHGRATAHLHTGYLPQGPIRFPALGSLVANELADDHADLPGCVSVLPEGAFAQPAVAAGFLGPRFAPLVVSDSAGSLRVDDLQSASVSEDRQRRRLEMLRQLEAPFLQQRPGPGSASHVAAYDRAERLGKPAAREAFALDSEQDALRDQYGRTPFGQGCLLARRLVERGVPFVEVTLGGWDTHDNNFEQVRSLCGVLDPAWATLTEDLQARGLLEETLVVWAGEFGRTPGINPRQGRDHFPVAWSTVLGGGGVQGGGLIGRTSRDGLAVDERPASVPDLMATIYLALGLDPQTQNMSNVGRPIRLADPAARPLAEILP
jgi:hypothetical protein